MLTAVRAALRKLADARADLVSASDELAAKRAAFEAEHANLVARVNALRTAAAEAEGDARLAVETHYHETKEKRPVPGAEVKLFKVCEYDPTRALAWAQEKQMCVVPESLDVKAFEKIAAATPLEFVTWKQEPRVTIAKQLNPVDLADPVVEAILNSESPF